MSSYDFAQIEFFEREVGERRRCSANHGNHHVVEDRLVQVLVRVRPGLFHDAIDPFGTFDVREEHLEISSRRKQTRVA